MTPLNNVVVMRFQRWEFREIYRRAYCTFLREYAQYPYEEIMNKASCLSLVSNAILYWNTLKIDSIIQNLRRQGEEIDDETLSHISLLPFKHVLPNGTYFIEDL